MASLGRLIGQVERQVSRRLEVVLSHEGLSLDQWRVLDLLSDGEGHPMSEIAGQIIVPGPTLTKIADRLVDAALVYRLVDDTDRRRVLVFMSDHGRRLHDRLGAEVTGVESEILDGLAADGERLVGLLAQLAAHLRTGPLEQRPSGG